MNEEDKIIEEQIKLAPAEIKKYLGENRWASSASEISRKNNFSEEQTVSLNNEILIVLLGLDLVLNFKKNIQESLAIPEILANDINLEVQEKIFSEVFDYLPREMEESSAPKEEAPTEPVMTPPLGTPVAPQAEENRWWENRSEVYPENQYKIAGTDAPQTPTSEVPVPESEVPVSSENLPEILPHQELVEKKSPEIPVPPAPTKEFWAPAPPKIPLQTAQVSPPPIIETPVTNEALPKDAFEIPKPTTPPPPPPSLNNNSFLGKIAPQAFVEEKSSVDETLSKLSEDEEEWQKRKEMFATQAEKDRILKSEYPTGQDPYREPI